MQWTWLKITNRHEIAHNSKTITALLSLAFSCISGMCVSFEILIEVRDKIMGIWW